jgi:hypothetical protein
MVLRVRHEATSWKGHASSFSRLFLLQQWCVLLLSPTTCTSPLQDLCVSDTASDVVVNNHVCKDPSQVTSDDFDLTDLHIVGDMSNGFTSKVTLVDARVVWGAQLAGRLHGAPQPGA